MMQVIRGTTEGGKEITIPSYVQTWSPLKRLDYYAGLVKYDVNIDIEVTLEKHGFAVIVGPERDQEIFLALDYEGAYYLIKGIALGGYLSVAPRG